MAVSERGTVSATQFGHITECWQPFCIMHGTSGLETHWRGQRLFGVTCAGVENAGRKTSMRE